MIEQISDPVKKFLAEDPIPHEIGGASTTGRSGQTWDVINPADASLLARTALGSPEDIGDAVQAANKGFATWSRMPANERATLMHRLADRMEAESETLAQLETLDVGKAITVSSSFDVPFGVEGVRYFADLSTRTTYSVPLPVKNIEARKLRVPYGVCGFIFPWNFPLDLFQWGVMPAIAAGNTVVVKPSEITPLSSLYMARLAREAGIPDGVINVVVGTGPEVGRALTEHPLVRRMSFTGSPEVGKRIGETCGRRIIPCKLELGGKGAAVVFDDVDIPATAKSLAEAITLNTGQVCCTATRWILHDSIYEPLVEEVKSVLRNTKIGPGLDPETEMGPLVSETQQKRVLDYYEKGLEQGATAVLEGGKAEGPGYYVTPYLLTGDPDNVCYREEIFGPAAFLTRFRDEDNAVEQVNSLSYGLANSVWTGDRERANRVAERMVAGNSWINAHNVLAYGLPYGGYGLSGTGGGVNSPETFEDYLRDQTIARPL